MGIKSTNKRGVKREEGEEREEREDGEGESRWFMAIEDEDGDEDEEEGDAQEGDRGTLANLNP